MEDLLSLEAAKNLEIKEFVSQFQNRPDFCLGCYSESVSFLRNLKQGNILKQNFVFHYLVLPSQAFRFYGGSALFSTVYLYLNEVYERYRLTTWNISVFSLFSVVQFKNTGCKSQSAMTSGQRYSQLTLITFELIKIPLWFPMTQVTDFHFSTVRNGTCYTSSECTSKGGTASGNCAAG